MTDLEKLQLKARDAMFFIECHPALCCRIFDLFDNISFSIQACCKNGHSKVHMIKVWYGKGENYKKYQKQFDKEFKEFTEEQLKIEKPLISIEVPYEKIYGEKWKFDHVEYWGDISFKVFSGLDAKDEKESRISTNWSSYQGVSTSSSSFEQMMIDLATKVKKSFGNFDYEDFLTDKEKQNHKSNWSIRFKSIKDKPGYSTLERNKKYNFVTDAQLNLRWLEWFKTKNYCKKNWNNEFSK